MVYHSERMIENSYYLVIVRSATSIREGGSCVKIERDRTGLFRLTKRGATFALLRGSDAISDGLLPDPYAVMSG